MLAGERSSRYRLVLRGDMLRSCRPIPLAAIRRLIRVAVVPGLLRRLPCRNGAVASSGDRAQRGWIRDLPLQAGQLQLVSGNRLLEAILHVGGRRLVGLLRRLYQLRGVVELVVERVERAAGQVEPVTGEHRLRLGEPLSRELEMKSQLVRGAEGKGSAGMLPGALQWVQGGI